MSQIESALKAAIERRAARRIERADAISESIRSAERLLRAAGLRVAVDIRVPDADAYVSWSPDTHQNWRIVHSIIGADGREDTRPLIERPMQVRLDCEYALVQLAKKLADVMDRTEQCGNR